MIRYVVAKNQLDAEKMISEGFGYINHEKAAKELKSLKESINMPEESKIKYKEFQVVINAREV